MYLAALVQFCCVFVAAEKITLKLAGGGEKEYSTAGGIFAASGALQECMGCRDKAGKGPASRTEGELGKMEGLRTFAFTQETFDMLEWMMEGDAAGVPDMDGCPLVPLMHAGDCLGLQREELLARIGRGFAEKGLGGEHLEKILQTEMEKGGGPGIYSQFTLALLGAYAGMCGTRVCMKGAPRLCASKKRNIKTMKGCLR